MVAQRYRGFSLDYRHQGNYNQENGLTIINVVTMVKDLFRRYIWLVDTVFRAGRLTFEEINGRWKRTEMSGGEDLPLKTFHNHRQAIADIFGIDIECSKRGGYYYYIGNADDIENGGVRAWLLNTFAVSNLINESHQLRHRILFEEIPSGQRFLAPVIEAMKEGVRIEVTYRSFGRESAFTVEVEPYCVKVFRQRWYMLAHSPGAGGLCIYSLDRVEGLSLTENKFDLPENFDAESYFHDSFGIIVYAGSPAEIVRLRVYGGKRDYFRTLPLHHSQKEVGIYEEYSIFEYFISPTFDFQQEILSHGDEVEVLSPEHFREEVGAVVRTMADYY